MKRILSAALILSVLAAMPACGLAGEQLIYQAHRGLSTEYPENTLPAFEAAVQNGFKIIELDPNFTADGYCILMHDANINRTCRQDNGFAVGYTDIPVRSLTYQELQAYDAGVFKGEQFKGTKVPLLAEAAQLVKGTGVTLKVDNKIWGFSDAELEIIFAIAEQFPAEVGITCKEISQVERVIARLPQAIVHYDGAVDEAVCEQLRKIVGDNQLYIWYPIANAAEEICDAIRQYGHLGLWTVKGQGELQKAIRLKADVIETNGEVKPN